MSNYVDRGFENTKAGCHNCDNTVPTNKIEIDNGDLLCPECQEEE